MRELLAQYCLIPAIFALCLCSSTSAQDSSAKPSFINNAQTQAKFASSAASFAQNAGEPLLASAIQTGAVIVLLGDTGSGATALSIPAPNAFSATAPVIIAQFEQGNFDLAGFGVIHEWSHFAHNDEVINPDDPATTPVKQQEWACDETDAHCRTLASMEELYDETGHKVSCVLMEKLIADLEWTNFYCNYGFDAPGPAGPIQSSACQPEVDNIQEVECE